MDCPLDVGAWRESPGSMGLPEWLAHLSLGELTWSRGLDLWALIHTNGAGPGYLPLQDAVSRGLIGIEEKGSGVVSEVVAENRGGLTVLILEGDTLVGAKQNRVVVRSVLVPAGKSVPVRVGCMERGRWSGTRSPFRVGCFAVDPTVRMQTVVEANFARARRGVPAPDQALLWARCESKLAGYGVRSETRDYHCGLSAVAGRFEKDSRSIGTVENQVGILALWRGHLLGFELVGHPGTWKAVASRWLPAYLMAAAEFDPDSRPAAARRTPEQWFDVIRAVRVHGAPSAGLGEDLTLEGDGVAGAGLWNEGAPAHCVVFSG